MAHMAHEACLSALLNAASISRTSTRAALNAQQRRYASDGARELAASSRPARRDGERKWQTRPAHSRASTPVPTLAKSLLRFTPMHHFYLEQDSKEAAIRRNRVRIEAKRRADDRKRHEEIFAQAERLIDHVNEGVTLLIKAGPGVWRW
jgi:hypothetical protein